VSLQRAQIFVNKNFAEGCARFIHPESLQTPFSRGPGIFEVD
jgi:hypothetical protein